MAIKLADFFIGIAADGSKYTAELKKTQKQTTAWSKDVEKASAAASKALKGLTVGAGIAVTGLAAVYAINAKNLDALGKTSAKLGESAENMRIFGLAAEYGGLASSQANVGLQRMVRRLAEAAEGGGAAASAIDELGLDAAALAAMNPAAAFEEITGRLEEIPLAADRVRLAMKFFDSEGVGLVNVTRDVLQKARDDVDALGGALTSLEISQIEAANDSITRVGLGVDLLTDRFTAKLAPAVGGIADALFEGAKQGQQFNGVMDALILASLEGTSSVFTTISAAVRFFDGRSELASVGLVGYALFGKKGFAIGAAIGATAPAVKDLYDTVKLHFSEGATEVEKLTEQIELMESKLKILELPVIGKALATEEGLKAYKEEIAQLKEVRYSMEGIGSATSRVGDETTDFSKALVDGLEFAAGTIDDVIRKYGEIGDVAANSAVLVSPKNTPASGQSDVDDEDPPKKPNDPYDDGAFSFAEMAVKQMQEAAELQAEEAERQRQFKANYFSQALADEKKFQQTLTLFQNSGLGDRAKILRKETAGAFNVLAQHSRKMFELNKAFSFGDAIVSISRGISNALALPFPANLKAAAVVGLEGAAQIKTIHSTQFGGGGSLSSPSSSSSSDASSAGSSLISSNADSTSASQDSKPQLNMMLFHSPGASAEQRAEEVAQSIQMARDNDLLDSEFEYTGDGLSSSESRSFERVA